MIGEDRLLERIAFPAWLSHEGSFPAAILDRDAAESIESNGVADAVKLAVCSCIEIVSSLGGCPAMHPGYGCPAMHPG